MTEAKIDYVPIDEVESPKLRVLLPLPGFVDQSQILIGVNPINRLFSIAGINHLRIRASQSDETSNFQPTVVGFDPEGGAYAGKTGLKTSVPTYSFESVVDDSNSIFLMKQVNGTININLEEMARRITEEKRWETGVRSPQPWAHYLNKAFKGSIQHIGLKHLLVDFNRDDLFLITFNQMAPLIFTFGGTPEQIVRAFIIQNILLNGLHLLFRTPLGMYVRPSLIYGPQLDRAAVFKFYLATYPLVKTA